MTYYYYLLVCMLAQQLGLGLLSSFSAVLCLHFFPCLQVTLACQSSHAGPSLLLQPTLHAQQLSVEHTEQPLLGLGAGLAAEPQTAQQGGHHVLVDLNPAGLQVIGGTQQRRHFKTYRDKM